MIVPAAANHPVGCRPHGPDQTMLHERCFVNLRDQPGIIGPPAVDVRRASAFNRVRQLMPLSARVRKGG